MASSGKARRKWPEIQKALNEGLPGYEARFTEAPGHAATLTIEALGQGFRKIAAVGGDGTVNEIVNAIMRQQDVPTDQVTMGQVPVGTGNDLGRTLGIPSKSTEAVALLRSGKARLLDVGRVTYAEKGEARERFFLNVAGMGYDAFVGEAVNAKKAQGKGGAMAYLSALVSCLMRYKSIPISVTADDYKEDTRLFSLVVGNCKYNGGGMKQAPDAQPDDGYLDLTIIRNLSKMAVVANVPRLFSGKFVKHRKVSTHRARNIRITGKTPVMLETDGEVIGTGPAEFSIRPGSLRFICSSSK